MRTAIRIPDRYTIALVLIIVSMCMGVEFFGSYQPTRLLLIFFFFLYFPNILRNKLSYSLDQPILIGVLLFIVWIVYGTISLLWSPDPIVGLKSELIVMGIGFLSLPVCFYFTKKIENPLLLLRKGWRNCFFITAVIGLIELITWKHLPSSGPNEVLGGVGVAVPHASATFGNVNDYGAFIVFVIPYLLWGILDEKQLKNKAPYMVALLMGILIVVVNGSRMGMFVIAFQILWFLVPIIRKTKRIHFLGGIFVLSIMISFLPLEKLFYTMNYRLGAFATGDESSSERLAMIKSGLEMLKGSYGVGVGAGGFEKSVIHQPSFLGNIVNPHNLFVEVFAQYGIIIFVLFCFWLFSILYYAQKNKQLSEGASNAISLTIVALPCIGIMSSHSLGYTYLWLFLCCATVISAYRPMEKNGVSKSK